MPVKQVASDVLNWLCTWNVKSVLEVHKKACKTCEMCYLASVDASCGPDIWTLAGVTAQSCQFYNLSSISPGAIVLSPQIQVYSLETSQCELTVGNSAGDFTCVNLRDSHPHLLVCGNKDRRYDTLANMCTSSITVTFTHTHARFCLLSGNLKPSVNWVS